MFTANRIYGSINEELLETFINYPMGAGMGSSVGTSLPYFLSHVQPEPIGHENEYSRIHVDQGWIGLGLWLAFLYWTHIPRPKSNDKDLGFILFLMHSTTGMFWLTCFIGTGVLSSIPASAILLSSMGMLVGEREVERKRIIRLRRLKSWFARFQNSQLSTLQDGQSAPL